MSMNGISSKLALLRSPQESMDYFQEMVSPDQRLELENPDSQVVIDLAALRRKYEDTAGLKRRACPRFAFQAEVILFSANASFRTESVDVSEAGACLKEKVPRSFMGQPIHILFVYEQPDTGEKTRILFTAQVLGHSASTRIAFKSTSRPNFGRLQELLSELTPTAA